MTLTYYQESPIKIGTTQVPLSFDNQTIEIQSTECLKSLGVEKLAILKQVHGNEILEFSFEELLALTSKPITTLGIADGIIISDCRLESVRTSSLAIGIRTADCLPIIIQSKKYLSLVHAGWRGLALGILEKLIGRLRVLDQRNEKLKIWIGPAAKQCCYEVGSEVLNSLGVGHGNLDSHLKIDLQEAALIRMRKLLKSSEILIDKRCTICTQELYSFRRNKTEYRNFTFAVMGAL